MLESIAKILAVEEALVELALEVAVLVMAWVMGGVLLVGLVNSNAETAWVEAMICMQTGANREGYRGAVTMGVAVQAVAQAETGVSVALTKANAAAEGTITMLKLGLAMQLGTSGGVVNSNCNTSHLLSMRQARSCTKASMRSAYG